MHDSDSAPYLMGTSFVLGLPGAGGEPGDLDFTQSNSLFPSLPGLASQGYPGARQELFAPDAQ